MTLARDAWRDAAPWSLAASAAALVLYVFRAAPAPYLLDSTELVATTLSLTVSHPPGHPSYHLSHAWFLDAPLGGIAFRLHLLSALSCALLAGLIPFATCRLGWTNSTATRAAAALVAIAFAITNGVLFQAIRAEVYGFHAALVCAALAWLLRPPGRYASIRDVAVAAALLGIGLGNHHYLVLFAFPAFLVATLAFTAKAQRWSAVGVGCLFGALPLIAYAYLPLRGATAPRIGWGWPTSLDDVWWTISAKAFQKETSARPFDLEAGLTNVLGVLADQWNIALLVALGGFLLLALRDRRASATLGLLVAFNLVTQTLFAFDPLNPDVLGYFVVSGWAIALLVVRALTAFAGQQDRTPDGQIPVPHAAALIGALLVLAFNVAQSSATENRMTSLARVWSADDLRDAAWLDARPDALLISAYYETGFNAWYGQAVEDRRPDIVHVHRPHRTHGFLDEMVLAEAPELAATLSRPAETGLVDPHALRELAAQRPVYVEAGAPIEPEVARALLPFGLMLEFVAADLPDGDYPAAMSNLHIARLARLHERLAESDDIQARRNLLWATFNQAGLLAEAERSAHARRLAEAAALIEPNDPMVRDLLERLGPAPAVAPTNE